MSKWNGKIRCVVSSTAVWELDKIYKVVNGFVERADGGWSRLRYNDLDDFNSKMISKFEEISKSIPQPHKSLLKSGMKVVYRDGRERYVFLPANKLLCVDGDNGNFLGDYADNLLDTLQATDIMEIYSEDGELIAKREEKSAKDIKIEELEKRMRGLADEIAEMKGEYYAKNR